MNKILNSYFQIYLYSYNIYKYNKIINLKKIK